MATATLNPDGSLQSSGAYTDSYSYDPLGQPLYLLRQRSGTTSGYTYLLDGHGSVVGLADSAGHRGDRYQCAPYGAPTGPGIWEPVPQLFRNNWTLADPGPGLNDPEGNLSNVGSGTAILANKGGGFFRYAAFGDDPLDAYVSVNGPNITPSDEGGQGESGLLGSLGEGLSAEEQFLWDSPLLRPYATEADILKLQRDTNAENVLSYENAVSALTGLPGTDRVFVAGRSVEGGDVQFYHGQRLLLRREVKDLSPGSGQFGPDLNDAASGINHNGEVWIQIHGSENPIPGYHEAKLYVQNELRRFVSQPGRAPTLSEYANVRVTVVDHYHRIYAWMVRLYPPDASLGLKRP